MSENGEKPSPGLTRPERKFNRKQYEMLKSCSEKKDFSEWNQWREEHPDEKILLEGAELQGTWLQEANMQGADLLEANLQGARMCKINLKDAYLWKANLQNADLPGANLHYADLWGANLQDANLWKTRLQSADLGQANLQDANLQEADIQGAGLAASSLQGANLSRAIVDGKTLIWECPVDRDTNFEGVGLASARIDPGTKQLLEYNVRRANWIHWYRKEGILKKISKRLFIYPFWSISDYGLSTSRIVKTFLYLSFIFATIYFVWGTLDYYQLGNQEHPGLVSGLFANAPQGEITSRFSCLLMAYLRSFYYTTFNMTTLGFADTRADILQPGIKWWAGHIMLITQVILGYVLLAALVTRFVVIFAAGGPAETFAKRASEENPEADTEEELQEELIAQKSKEEPVAKEPKEKHKQKHKQKHKVKAEEKPEQKEPAAEEPGKQEPIAEEPKPEESEEEVEQAPQPLQFQAE